MFKSARFRPPIALSRPLRVSLPRPTKRGSARAFLVVFFLASILAWILFYCIPASPWNRWYPEPWHPAIYNPPPSLHHKWWHLFGNSRRWGTGPDPPDPASRKQPPSSPFYVQVTLECAGLPGAQDVLVVMRTSSVHTHSKIPTHLNSTFRCTPHFDIYSDLDEMIDGYYVHNALDDIPSGRMVTYPEFELYQEQLDAKRRGREDVAGLSHSKHLHHAEQETLIHKLDRWKLLPMLEKALLTKKTAKWFVFIEDDTAFLWGNLLLWLSKLDHHKPQYIGAQTWDDDLEYAHSGSGIILSNSAVRAVVDAAELAPSKFDAMVSDTCCGDRALALAMTEVGIPLTPSRPLVQHEQPSALDYTAALWCNPIVSFHRMSPTDVRELWEYEQTRLSTEKHKGPILHRDLFWAFAAHSLTDSRKYWNNWSMDKVYGAPGSNAPYAAETSVEVAALNSAKGCAHLCETVVECLQWRHMRGECALGFSIRLGNAQSKRKTSARDMLTSGWIRARIEAFVERLEPCDEPAWVSTE